MRICGGGEGTSQLRAYARMCCSSSREETGGGGVGGCVGVHLLGADAGKVRRRLDGGPIKYTEGVAGLGKNREDIEEGWDETCGVRYILQSGGPGSFSLWVINMGAIGVDGKEAGGSPRGIPLSGHGEDRSTTVGWDVEEGEGGECYQGNRDAYFQ